MKTTTLYFEKTITSGTSEAPDAKWVTFNFGKCRRRELLEVLCLPGQNQGVRSTLRGVLNLPPMESTVTALGLATRNGAMPYIPCPRKYLIAWLRNNSRIRPNKNDTLAVIGGGDGMNAGLISLVGGIARVIKIEFDPNLAKESRKIIAVLGADRFEVRQVDAHRANLLGVTYLFLNFPFDEVEFGRFIKRIDKRYPCVRRVAAIGYKKRGFVDLGWERVWQCPENKDFQVWLRTN